MNVKLVSSRIQVNIEDDSIYLYAADEAIGHSVVIPMSYCVITNVDAGRGVVDDVTITLKMIHEHSDRNIKFEGCFHKVVGSPFQLIDKVVFAVCSFVSAGIEILCHCKA